MKEKIKFKTARKKTIYDGKKKQTKKQLLQTMTSVFLSDTFLLLVVNNGKSDVKRYKQCADARTCSFQDV